MPSLAELIGSPPPSDVQLLQATVTAVSTGTATIHFGNAAETIAGVRYLASVSIAAADTVWVLRFGGALIIIGKLSGSPAGGVDISGILRAGSAAIGGASTADPEPVETHGGASGISIHDRSNDANRSVVYSDAGLGILWRGSNILEWASDHVTVRQALLGTWGNSSTFGEVRGDGTLANNGAGNPNYIVQAGSIVVNFVAGNGNFNFGVAFPSGLNSLVVSEAGGLGNCIVGTQNYSRTGAGVYAVYGGGATVNGFVRFNYFALGF